MTRKRAEAMSGTAARAATRAGYWSLARLALVLFLAPQLVLAFDLQELSDMLRRVEASKVAFEETKHVSSLTAPLIRRGVLQYVRPDRLEMRVESPFYERVEIIGNDLTIETRRGKRTLDLASQPAAGAWVASIRATLAGDVETLNAHFRARVSGDKARWKLELTPRDRDFAALVKRIELDGAQAGVTAIEIEEAGGDRSVMTIAPIDQKLPAALR
ncbi:MAG: LolA-related protein [Casimicrobiaceae bacterium]